MARAKNRGYQQSFSPSYTIRRWRLGIYIRLSKEDLKKGKDDSNSVKNQRDLLNDFYRRNIDEFESITEYVDDGHTGTDANREDFQRLLADVMSGKINCVIVKDLSRFARNYSDAGSLIDNLFVQMGVRFISLAENVDSYKNPDSVSNIIVPITNVMNDNYCYQTSKKIRQALCFNCRERWSYSASYFQRLNSWMDRMARYICTAYSRVIKTCYRAGPERTRRTEPLGLQGTKGLACFDKRV